jgi:Mrp family chromosome partitioning ATPase/capsular polysaccharide biosynthesis protein
MTATTSGTDGSAAALGQYLGAIRARPLVVLLVTLATVGVAAALLATRTPRYESSARLLVAPLPQDDRTFLGSALLRDSGDPTRTVQTAAALVDSPLAAQDTARRLGGGLTADDVARRVDVQPLGDSNLLSVTASAPSAAGATRLAAQYVRSALAVRGRLLRPQLDAAIAAIGPRPAADDALRLAELRAVRRRGDPTLTMAQAAQPPQAASGPPAVLVLILAAIAGFTLGSIAALLMERFDRRVRDAGELLALSPIPVMLRVPATSPKGRHAAGDRFAWSVREAFRTLQIELDQRRSDAGGAGQKVMVTSASSADGKTTTALNLAFALVGAGHRVILMDCDLRRPDIARQLSLPPSDGFGALLTSRVALSEVLQPARPNLQVLAPARGSRDNSLLHGLDRRIGEILDDAVELADYVIVDSAPLGEVGDPLTIAGHVDAVLLVVRPHHTNREALRTTVGLLDRARTTPAGWVVIGDEGARLPDSYRYADPDGSGRRRGRIRSLAR